VFLQKRRAVGDHVWIAGLVEEVVRDKHEVHKIGWSTRPDEWFEWEVTAVRRAIDASAEPDFEYQVKLVNEGAFGKLHGKGFWFPGHRLRDENDRKRHPRYSDVPDDLFERRLSVESTEK
jgi:hypothetical protein